MCFYQISALDGLAKVAGSKCNTLNHMARFNTIAHDQAQAAAVIDAGQNV